MTTRKQKWVSLSRWYGKPIRSLTEARVIHQRWVIATGVVTSSLRRRGKSYVVVYRETISPESVTLALSAYLTYCKGRKTAKTLSNESFRLGRFAAWLGYRNIKTLGRIRHVHISEWVDSLECGVTTKNLHLSHVKTWMNWAVGNDLIEASPATRVKNLPNYDPKPSRSLTADEVKTIETKFPEPERSFCMIALYTGLRLGEICHLQWADIDADHHEIVIRPDNGSAPKGTRSRKDFDKIPIHPKVQAVLDAMLHRGRYVFSKERKDEPLYRSFNNWYVRVKALFHAYGIENAHIHTMRHTFCTMMARAGLSHEAMARIGRHKDPATTRRYLHLTLQDLHSEITKVC